jgi:transposase
MERLCGTASRRSGPQLNPVGSRAGFQTERQYRADEAADRLGRQLRSQVLSISPFQFFLGIDLGSSAHQVRLLDGNGQPVGERTVEHGGQAIGEFLNWLAKATSGIACAQVAAAVEAPRGAVTDALLERGYAVFSINPKQLDRFRDRFSVAGAKDDRRDALVLAASLRTDRQLFRQIHGDDPRILRIRELSRFQDALQEDFRRTCNQLWSYLQRYFPALLTLCSSVDQVWLWDLLEHCHALPSRAAGLRPKTLEQLLGRHRIRRFTARELHDLLADPLPLASGVDQALAEQVRLLLPRLRLLHQQRAEIAQRIELLVEELAGDENFSEHRSIAILRSVPGLGRVCIATVLAEAFQPLQERDYHYWRMLAGVAPVTQQSGKTRLVSMRRACNVRLREAFFHAAMVHMQKDPRAHLNYRRLREHNHSHGRALRGIADRLLELICLLLRNQTPYDGSRRSTKAA